MDKQKVVELEFELLDIAHCFNTKPEPLDFILPGFVAGTVGALVAPGSTGKSYVSIETAVGVASNEADRQLLNLNITKEGEVAIFNAEDPPPVLHQRLHAIAGHLHPDLRSKVIKSLSIHPLVGKQADVMDAAWQSYILRKSEGKRLLIFDTFTRWHRLDENSNGQMSQVVGVFEMIANKTGASVLFLHHTGKSAAMNGENDKQQATRGASAIVDNCRWQAFLQTMTEDEAKKLTIPADIRKNFVQFGGNKENYGSPTSAKWLVRGEGGVLLPATDVRLKSKPALTVVNCDNSEKKSTNNNKWSETVKNKIEVSDE